MNTASRLAKSFAFLTALRAIAQRVVSAPYSFPVALPGKGSSEPQDTARVLAVFRAMSGRAAVPSQVADLAAAMAAAAWAAHRARCDRFTASQVVDETTTSRAKALREGLWTAWKRAGYTGTRVAPTLNVYQARIGDEGCTASSETDEGWIKYSARESHRGVVGHAVRLTVRPHWRASVERRGLAVVDGLLTLCARPVEAPARGVEAYAAAWVEQSRGASVKVTRGFIVRFAGSTVHGASVASAWRTLRARTGGAPVAAALTDGERLTRAVSRALKHADVTVTFADSHHAGNCETGTLDWCARWLPGRTAATVGEVLAVLGGDAQGDRALLALGACLYAIRMASRRASVAA
jgi:ethanolamine utilization microcompartment shell protein EutS